MNAYKPQFKLTTLTVAIRMINKDYDRYITPFVYYPEPDEE